MTSTIDFPTWFNLGCYGGLICCMCAIAVNALYTSIRRYGTTRQLARAIVTCVLSALLLFLALAWRQMRFDTLQASLALIEVEGILGYIAFFGLALPIGVVATYIFFAAPRSANTSMQLPSQRRSTRANTTSVLRPPRHQSGILAPFVFAEDIPWGWLEYRNGRLQGQRLELKRAIVTIGRDENNDIWLDDDLASRHHAELAWDKGQVYITDCDSLNGVVVGGRRIRGSTILDPEGFLEIGSLRFVFHQAAPGSNTLLQDEDPLEKHVWRPIPETSESFVAQNHALPGKDSTHTDAGELTQYPTTPPLTGIEALAEQEWEQTAQVDAITPQLLPTTPGGAFLICDGEMAGMMFLFDRATLVVGRGQENDITIDDVSISRAHVQFVRQASGNYIQDLASRNGTTVNDEPLSEPRLLTYGDIIRLGNIRLLFVSAETANMRPPAYIITPRSSAGPIALRLPTKPS